MPVYATAPDLTAFMGSQPDSDVDVTPMLRKASLLVTTACRLDCYDVTPTGIPSDEDLAEAMRDAVCAQVELWVAAGYNPVAGAGGQDPRVTVSAVDGASVSFDTYLTAPARINEINQLCPDSLRILRNAGLASSAVW